MFIFYLFNQKLWHGSGWATCIPSSNARPLMLHQNPGWKKFMFLSFVEQKFIQLLRFGMISSRDLGCEPLTHMGDKTNGEPSIWVERTSSQFSPGILAPNLTDKSKKKKKKKGQNDIQSDSLSTKWDEANCCRNIHTLAAFKGFLCGL